jgi:hypothetical protein
MRTLKIMFTFIYYFENELFTNTLLIYSIRMFITLKVKLRNRDVFLEFAVGQTNLILVAIDRIVLLHEKNIKSYRSSYHGASLT